MNHPLHKRNKNSSLTAPLVLATVLITATSVSAAEEANVAYVDSVLKWGAWGLDIEPAAGGLSAASTQALNARNSKLAIRTNSFSALAPTPTPTSPIVRPPTTPPPVIPVPPPGIPTITPISPNIPVPIGGPGGSAPAPSINSTRPGTPIPTGGPGGGPGNGGPGVS